MSGTKTAPGEVLCFKGELSSTHIPILFCLNSCLRRSDMFVVITLLYLAPGGVFSQKTSSPRSDPLQFYIPFLTENVSFSYTFF